MTRATVAAPRWSATPPAHLAPPARTEIEARYHPAVVEGLRDRGRLVGRAVVNDKDGVGLYYKVINRNKRSVTLDMKDAGDLDKLKALVRDAD